MDHLKTMVKECNVKEISCDKNQRCIPYHWLCDGHKDCNDQADESTICQKVLPTNYYCPKGYFKCINRPLCIPDYWRCDQEQDCGDDDLSDEDNCN